MSITPAKLPTDITEVVNTQHFNERVIDLYERGYGDLELEADLDAARSVIPSGTGALRDFSFIAPDIPEFIARNCVACMDCVTECPDTAILAKVIPEEQINASLEEEGDEFRAELAGDWAETRKFHATPAKRGKAPASFGIFIDPTKCKGCAECVAVCDDDALKMIKKTDDNMPLIREKWEHFKRVGPSDESYVMEKVLSDMMLVDRSLQYVGGAGSCAGCGEASALRMMVAATCFKYGEKNLGLIAATGCNTVYTSTYPYNPYRLPWANSLFENAPTYAMGVRSRWDQAGLADKKLWVIGGDGAMLDIGFQALSRMLMSGMDLNVIVLDTQVYSNTGGQASKATPMAAVAKFAAGGKSLGKKDLGMIAMTYGHVYVAQIAMGGNDTQTIRAIQEAAVYEGPSLVIAYSQCIAHGIDMAKGMQQQKLAVESGYWPLYRYNPALRGTGQNPLRLDSRPPKIP
ncbi:MAG: thiamine pyrophosphate-dependent enzyme, partial [Planctomycetota bacterium]|nr:thiamine pyrophosphate-dependent enzyme [Planctomycetota bacterium]